jgi:hypothetical protein
MSEASQLRAALDLTSAVTTVEIQAGDKKWLR